MINPIDASGARPSLEIIQLEKHNDRLKEALVRYLQYKTINLFIGSLLTWYFLYRLRDVMSEQEAELNKKNKTLEKELASLQDIQGYFTYIFKSQ
jgi:hypothetical protein